MTTTTTTADADAAADTALKQRHRAMWALGDYHAVATEIIPALGPVLVQAAHLGPADDVLDVAAGSGNVAIPAAATGARVVASDLTPELLDLGRADAEAAGVQLDWRVADAEALPFDDNSFDAVTSCVGVMFAPHHQVAADELVRVCRPGGRIAVISWTPAGFIGQMFATMKPYVAPPPPGAQPPPLWGDLAHVRELFGDRVTDLRGSQQLLRVDGMADPAGFREYFKQSYGPTIAAYRGLEDDPSRAAELDDALDALVERFRSPEGTVDWEYLLVVATVV
ncbi:MAG TPA: methyltransferase domain-containing protein [Nocardioides sp.]|uniref:class I SAM-dependent methyltransferase n=1 Tax=Nocardioides sp. TaxID=35761 RepID=UPI002E350055|nr:methyltransferase domain-containing protein [Nocardioides sp.]HEX3929255.1 methyltransferase domain-containing protein [Nocardioides sp.]